MPDPQQMSDRDLIIATYTRVDGLVQQGNDHEQRIRRLERALWIGVGVASGIGAAIGSAVGSITTAV